MQGYPPCIFIIGAPIFGQLLPKGAYFALIYPLKGGYFLQEIGHFWPFYRAILLGLGSPFLLFSEKRPKSTLFPHEISFSYSYKKSVLN
jgi:hypothetical protein